MGTVKRPLLDIAPRHLLILAVPIAVVAFTEFLLGWYSDGAIGRDWAIIDDPAYAELTARYKALAAFVFFVTISVAVIAIFACDVLCRFTFRARIKILVALILTVIAALLFSSLKPEELDTFDTYQLLGGELFHTVLGAARTGSGGTAFHMMKWLVEASSQVVAFSATAALAGIVLALASRPDATTHEEEAEVLREAQATARRYLYCSGLLLTAGMIWVHAWMSWPGAVLAEEADSQAFNALVDAFSLFRGTSFTLLILSVYLPVQLVLTMRLDDFRHGLPAEATIPDDAMPEPGSYTAALKTITAILAPILISVIDTAWSVSF